MIDREAFGAVFIVACLFSVVAVASILQPTGDVISSSGEILGVGLNVFETSDCKVEVTSIDWGVLSPGENKSVSYYLRNERNWELVAAKNETNWVPLEAKDYIALTWSYNNESLGANQVVPITFTLSVSPDIHDITTFSFNIILYQQK